MSTHVLPWAAGADPYEATAAATSAVRAPTTLAAAGAEITFVYVPDLTAPEVVALTAAIADVVATSRARDGGMTYADYLAIKPQLTTGRAFLALSQNDFIALTQNQRDRMLHDNVSAQWRVIFRLLRD